MAEEWSMLVAKEQNENKEVNRFNWILMFIWKIVVRFTGSYI